jgi:hypothetical protein
MLRGRAPFRPTWTAPGIQGGAPLESRTVPVSDGPMKTHAMAREVSILLWRANPQSGPPLGIKFAYLAACGIECDKPSVQFVRLLDRNVQVLQLPECVTCRVMVDAAQEGKLAALESLLAK